MKRGLLHMLFVLMPLLLAVSCQEQPNVEQPDHEGTWVLTSATGSETFAFTATDLAVTDAGTSPGSLDCTIVSSDTSAKHIQMSVLASTGKFTTLTFGMSMFLTYNISGNSMEASLTVGTYAPSASSGPYLKQ